MNRRSYIATRNENIHTAMSDRFEINRLLCYDTKVNSCDRQWSTPLLTLLNQDQQISVTSSVGSELWKSGFVIRFQSTVLSTDWKVQTILYLTNQ